MTTEPITEDELAELESVLSTLKHPHLETVTAATLYRLVKEVRRLRESSVDLSGGVINGMLDCIEQSDDLDEIRMCAATIREALFPTEPSDL